MASWPRKTVFSYNDNIAKLLLLIVKATTISLLLMEKHRRQKRAGNSWGFLLFFWKTWQPPIMPLHSDKSWCKNHAISGFIWLCGQSTMVKRGSLIIGVGVTDGGDAEFVPDRRQYIATSRWYIIISLLLSQASRCPTNLSWFLCLGMLSIWTFYSNTWCLENCLYAKKNKTKIETAVNNAIQIGISQVRGKRSIILCSEVRTTCCTFAEQTGNRSINSPTAVPPMPNCRIKYGTA